MHSSISEIINGIFRTPWHLMRWVRLIVGVWAIINFARAWHGTHTPMIEYVVLAAGIYFVYKAIFNTGCEVQNTYTPNAENEDQTTTVDYEEIK